MRLVSDENLVFFVQTLRNYYLGHCNIPNLIFNGGHLSSQLVGVNVGKTVGVPPGGPSSLSEIGRRSLPGGSMEKSWDYKISV